MDDKLPHWVREASGWPLAFAQVREDPLLDGEIIAQCGDGARVMMVASGGCTAVHLAANHALGALHLVDPNPAQLALTRLKLHLLKHAGFESRQAILGHRPMPAEQRQVHIHAVLQELKLPDNIMGPLQWIANIGPDFAGRYERVFAELRIALQPQAVELDGLLKLRDPAEQQKRAQPGTMLGEALDRSIDEVMSLPNLVALFGEGATRNRAEPFSRHFARRTRHALATMPAVDNPYLWQMYRGVYPPDCEPQPRGPNPSFRHRTMTWSNTTMNAALRDAHDCVDFIHLSNILDWLSQGEAEETLTMAARALSPGGYVFIRQLNSTLDIPAMATSFDWLPTSTMLQRDRSFFYRSLHLGKKR